MSDLLMVELIKALRSAPSEKREKLLREHVPVASHCPRCHTTWPCTLWAATAAASRQPEGQTA